MITFFSSDMAQATLLLCLLVVSLGTVLADSTVSNSTDTTTAGNGTVYGDTQERSLFNDLPRQGRIINDDKISIKGFIPIVGLGEDSMKDKNKDQENLMEKYMKNMASMMGNADNGHSPDGQSNLQQFSSPSEDPRYIGAALQGLLGNVGSIRKSGYGLKPQGITRKSDCVCVPFYMCKNGLLSDSHAQADLSSMYNGAYEQRRGERHDQHSYQAPVEEYLPINERSNDNLNMSNSKFTEEILGRMLGGKSMSDGCGLLRTCCQRANPNQMIPSEMFTNGDYAQMMPELSAMYKPTQQAYMPYKPNSYHKPAPGGYYNPTMRPPMPHQRPYRPPKLINSPSQMEAMIEAPLPVPVRHQDFSGMGMGMGMANMGMNSMGMGNAGLGNIASLAYDKCGSRMSVGINGRVQNLNYHESSTEFGEFPWQVAILKKLSPSDNLFVCGGALISSHHILTAAHCIKKFQAHDLKVRLGEWDVHREDEIYPYIEKNVDDILVHPHFSPRNLANDVAILRIDTEIDFNQHPHISPICLAEPFEVFAGTRCYVSGWGKNSFGTQGEYQSVLMKVDLPVIDTRQCEGLLRRTKLGRSFRLDHSMICAGGEHGKDACEGDGGSGLVCDVNGTWKVAGLVSWGLGCGQQNVPGVYTNIAQVRSWLDKVVFPYYAAALAAKSSEKNFNELISERSLDGAKNGTVISTASNSTSL